MTNSAKTGVSVFIATSLDGYISRPDGDIDWLNDAESPGEGDDCGFGEMFASVDALVMGRNTFEKVLEFGLDKWPYGDKAVIVLSRNLTEIPKQLQATVSMTKGSPKELISELNGKGYRQIYLDGGKTIQAFLRNGLVNDLTITTIPILIGRGRSLFGELEIDIKLRHLQTQSWKNGFVQSRYEVTC